MTSANHEYYVSLEVAKLLKEAGFDWELNSRWQDWGGKNSHEFILKTDLFYTDRPAEYDGFHALPAPTLDVAQRWLRDVKNIALYVCPSYEPVRFVAPNVVADDEKWVMKWQVSATHYDIEADEIDFGDVEEEIFDTYEEAQEAGIQKCLTIIIEEKKYVNDTMGRTGMPNSL